MNMKNIVICGLIIATTLAPLSAAASQSYTAPFLGLPFHFDIAGTLASVPMLQQSSGTAVIVDAVFNPLNGRWSGDIVCVVPDVDNKCTGSVSS